jgi:CFEM domain
MSPSSWMRFSGRRVNSSLVFQALSLIFLSITSAQNASPGTITIQNSPSFSSQRQCAQECFTGEWGGDLGLGCPSPIENACYCRADLVSSAIYTLSSCVYNGCSLNANDVQTAIGLYSTYCDVTAQPSTIASPAVTAQPSAIASPAVTVTAPANTIIVKSSTNSLTVSPSEWLLTFTLLSMVFVYYLL